MKKIVTYSEAINSGLNFCLKSLKNTLVIGQGVDAIDGVFEQQKFSKYLWKKRVFDFPISESLMTSASIDYLIAD